VEFSYFFPLSPNGGEGRVRGKWSILETIPHPDPLPSQGRGGFGASGLSPGLWLKVCGLHFSIFIRQPCRGDLK